MLFLTFKKMFFLAKYWKVPLHLLINWLNGRWFLQSVDREFFNMEVKWKVVSPVGDRDSGNLYPLYSLFSCSDFWSQVWWGGGGKILWVSFWTFWREISGDLIAIIEGAYFFQKIIVLAPSVSLTCMRFTCVCVCIYTCTCMYVVFMLIFLFVDYHVALVSVCVLYLYPSKCCPHCIRTYGLISSIVVPCPSIMWRPLRSLSKLTYIYKPV